RMYVNKANDDRYELLKTLAWNQILLDLHFCGEQAAQRVTLVDGKRANDTARIRDGLEPLSLTGRQPHFNPPPEGAITSARAECARRYLLLIYFNISTRQGAKNLHGKHSPRQKMYSSWRRPCSRCQLFALSS